MVNDLRLGVWENSKIGIKDTYTVSSSWKASLSFLYPLLQNRMVLGKHITGKVFLSLKHHWWLQIHWFPSKKLMQFFCLLLFFLTALTYHGIHPVQHSHSKQASPLSPMRSFQGTSSNIYCQCIQLMRMDIQSLLILKYTGLAPEKHWTSSWKTVDR